MSLNEMSFSPVRMRGSSEESAIAQALMIVGATREQVQIEVVEQDEKGVTVRVSPRQSTSEKEEAATEVAGDDANDAITGATQDDEIAPDLKNETPLPQNDSSDYASSAAGDLDATINPETIAEIATVSESEDEADESAEPELMEAESMDSEATEAQSAVSASAPVSEEARERAGAMAREMLERMGLDANVSVADGPFSSLEAGDEDAQSRVYLQVEGEDVGILIGKHGATLQSFQYLLNLSLNNAVHNARDNEDGEGEENAAMLRVVVDAGGYRAKRADMLEKSAQDGAERARRDRRSIRLEPMPAHERRLVHMALRDEVGLVTSSEGREPLRHVVISPEGMRPASNERGSGQSSRSGNRSARSGGYRGGRDRR